MTQLNDIRTKGTSLLEIAVHESNFQTNWDAIVFMAPFLIMMAVGMFRLDEHIFASKTPKHDRQRTFCGPDVNGQATMSDPDGRPWSRRPVRR